MTARRQTRTEAAEARDARFERAAEVERSAGFLGRRRAAAKAQAIRKGADR